METHQTKGPSSISPLSSDSNTRQIQHASNDLHGSQMAPLSWGTSLTSVHRDDVLFSNGKLWQINAFLGILQGLQWDHVSSQLHGLLSFSIVSIIQRVAKLFGPRISDWIFCCNLPSTSSSAKATKSLLILSKLLLYLVKPLIFHRCHLAQC